MLLVSVITAALAIHGAQALIVSRALSSSLRGWIRSSLLARLTGFAPFQNAFNLTMDPASISPPSATCTTCRFVEDKSNYWTAVMYFRHRNGSYIRVPQMANHNTGPGLQDGGMTVYYFQPGTDEGVTAFPPGFRMRVGYPNLRANTLDPQDISSRAVTLRCFDGLSLGNGAPGYDTADSFSFPAARAAVVLGRTFTSLITTQSRCWDGVNLDSPTHESHVTHPAGAFFGARCPSSHPVHMPVLFMEIVWDTRPFNDKSLWPEDGSQPSCSAWVIPLGSDNTRLRLRLEGDSLQRAMDTCTGGDGIPTNCPELTVQDMDSMNACKQHAKVPEIISSASQAAIPSQAGPASATVVTECDAASTTAAPLPTVPPAIVVPPWTVCHSGPGSEPLVPNCDSIPPKTTVADPGPARTAAPVVTAQPVA
ncbi:hypothetical protein D9611_014866 [Ephemerocybe angulata]|uniref:DUF1996 domain-containing protein n=1 Tax=Ephemerocybe angulata TaxID=980116 RepID=A0A8H5B8L0_9AGAR|nr:hypothetical protein D9611_014866 [Tulosesus angulatus]